MTYKNIWIRFLFIHIEKDIKKVQEMWDKLCNTVFLFIIAVVKLALHVFDILTYSFVCLWKMSKNKVWVIYYALIGVLLPDSDLRRIAKKKRKDLKDGKNNKYTVRRV